MLRRLKVRVSGGYGVFIGFFKSEKLKKTLEVRILRAFVLIDFVFLGM